MVKMVVLYKTPGDREKFDSHYLGTHVPLCEKLPGVQRIEVTRFTKAMGGDPPFYLMTEIAWNTQAEMDAALASPENKAVYRDARDNIEPGLMTVTFAEKAN